MDPCAAERCFDYSLLLDGAAAEGLPSFFGLRRVDDVQPMHVFGEPAGAAAAPDEGPLADLAPGAVVTAEGAVERKFDMHLTDAGGAEYRRLSRARTAAASNKTRLIRSLASFSALGAPSDAAPPRGRAARTAVEESAPHLLPLPRLKHKAPAAVTAGRAGGARSDDELQALLFDLFERRSHWKVAEIVSVTGENMARLRPALAQITEMDRRPGPQRGCYVLLPHLKKAES
jgi:hypothetical protein